MVGFIFPNLLETDMNTYINKCLFCLVRGRGPRAVVKVKCLGEKNFASYG